MILHLESNIHNSRVCLSLLTPIRRESPEFWRHLLRLSHPSFSAGSVTFTEGFITTRLVNKAITDEKPNDVSPFVVHDARISRAGRVLGVYASFMILHSGKGKSYEFPHFRLAGSF